MADISRNSFNGSKQYDKVIWQQGKAMLDFDLNEAQDLQRFRRDQLVASLVGSSKFVGVSVVPGGSARRVTVSAGVAYDGATMVAFPATVDLQVFSDPTVSGTVTSIVYVEWQDTEITSVGDADILDVTFGASTVRTKRTVEVKAAIGTTTVPVVGGKSTFLLATITHNFSADGTSVLQTDITPALSGITPGELGGAGVARTLRLKSNAPVAQTGWIFGSNNTLTGTFADFTNNATVLARLLGNGNFGINTLAPTERLHVTGNILASGTITGATLIGAVQGTTGSFSGNVTMAASMTVDGVDVGTHAHTGVGSDGAQIAHASLTGLTGTDHHTQYVHNTTARTITAVHTFNPVSTAAPFILGANALTQKVIGLNADLLDGQEGSWYQDWANLTNKPTTFAPAAHTHAWADVTGRPTTLAGYGIADAAALVHTHAASSIISGTFGVAQGGTGLATVTAGVLLLGNGTAAMTELTPSTAGNFVRSNGTAWARSTIQVGDLPGHTLLSHTASGLTAGQVVKATGATTFVFGALEWTEVANKPTTFTPTSHDLITAHTVSGLAVGQVLRATSATTVAFGALQVSDLPTHTHTFAQLTGLPTTLAGFGIADAAALVHTHAASSITAGTFGAGDYTFPANVAVVGQMTSTRFDHGNVSGAVTVNWNNGNQQRMRLAGAVTITHTNARPGAIYTLEIQQDNVGSRTLGHSSNTRWPNGIGPTLSTVPERVDVVTFLSTGTHLLGIESGFNYNLA